MSDKVTAYLAGPYSSRQCLVGLAGKLAAIGVEVTSTWLDGYAQIGPDGEQIGLHSERAVENLTDERLCSFLAARDIDDIKEAEFFVVLGGDDPRAAVDSGSASVHAKQSGGRHVELGVALALGKRIVLLGWPENIFHMCGNVVRIQPEEVVSYFRGVCDERGLA